MITPSPENYDFVQVARPLKGLMAREFLSEVRTIGRTVLGEKAVSSISQLSLVDSEVDDDSNEPFLMTTVVPTYEPRLDVCDDKDLSMIILHRSFPRHLASRFSPPAIQSRLSASQIIKHQNVTNEDGDERRAKVRIAGLPTQLYTKAAEHGFEDPEYMEIVCAQVGTVGEIGKDYILGLFPREGDPATRVLIEQAKISNDFLVKEFPKAGIPQAMWQVCAPFAKVPNNVDPNVYRSIFRELNAKMTLRLGMGAIENTVKYHPVTRH